MMSINKDYDTAHPAAHYVIDPHQLPQAVPDSSQPRKSLTTVVKRFQPVSSSSLASDFFALRDLFYLWLSGKEP